MTRYSPATAAMQWNIQNAAFGLLARTGVPVMRLRYEDFTAEPERTLRRVAGFAGRPARDSYPFLTADGGPSGGGPSGGAPVSARLEGNHSVSGNPMRFTTGPVPIRSDEQWRTQMPRSQQRAVTALTLPLMAGYGYLGARS
jgi:hypothetical protein